MTTAGVWNWIMAEERRANTPAWERHIQSVLTTLVLAGILWLGNTALENSTTTKVMAVEIKSMAKQIDRLEQGQFTAANGARLETRIGALEREFKDHLRATSGNGH